MNSVATATPAERLRLYRTRHRIEIDASGDWTTCATDSIKVYAVRGRQWRHDQDEIERLSREAYAESTRVALAIERISADFTAELEDDEPDFDREERQLAYERTGYDPTGFYEITPCTLPGHVHGCPGKAGGNHELMDGWIAFEDDGVLVEVEVAS